MILRIPWAFLIFSSLENQYKIIYFLLLGLVMCPINFAYLFSLESYRVKRSGKEIVCKTKQKTIRNQYRYHRRYKRHHSNCKAIAEKYSSTALSTNCKA
jgi:hypothetical protein